MDLAQAIASAILGARATDQKSVPLVLAVAGATPTTRDAYVELLKSTALSMGKQAVLKLLIPQLPKWLVSGFVGSIITPIIGFIVGKALEIAIRETEMGMFFLYIDLRTSAQGRAFAEAAQKNFESRKNNASPEEIAKAEKELTDAFRSFVKFTS